MLLLVLEERRKSREIIATFRFFNQLDGVNIEQFSEIRTNRSPRGYKEKSQKRCEKYFSSTRIMNE